MENTEKSALELAEKEIAETGALSFPGAGLRQDGVVEAYHDRYPEHGEDIGQDVDKEDAAGTFSPGS